jgi:hypothetical protein
VSDKWVYFNFNNEDLMLVTNDGSQRWGILIDSAIKAEMYMDYITNIQVFDDTVYFQDDYSDRFYRISAENDDWESSWGIDVLAETLAE